MSPTPQKQTVGQQMMRFMLTFAIVYLITTTAMRMFFPERFGTQEQREQAPITLNAPGKSVIGRDVEIIVHNNTEETIELDDRCPEPPLLIEKLEGGELVQLNLSEPTGTCEPVLNLPVGKTRVSLSPWKYDAFSEPGTYHVSFPQTSNDLTNQYLNESETGFDIRIKKPGIFVALFRAFVSKPLFNGLVFLASVLPNHSLGWSIILITLIVKLLLFLPSQHALESQKKMQAMQPKMEELKKKYAGDQQRITQETMALWKKEDIHPMQSCLPTLIQMPILIGLFFIIRDSGQVEFARHLLYPPFMNLNWSFDTMFLGAIDLAAIPFAGASWIPSMHSIGIILKGMPIPLAIALMQFAQMKMVFAKKKKTPNVIEAKKAPLAERMDTQTMMLYMLPIMIFAISGTLPIAVSLYWGASTAFSIGQQVWMNRK